MKEINVLLLAIIAFSCALLIAGRCQLLAGTLATGSALMLGKINED